MFLRPAAAVAPVAASPAEIQSDQRGLPPGNQIAAEHAEQKRLSGNAPTTSRSRRQQRLQGCRRAALHRWIGQAGVYIDMYCKLRVLVAQRSASDRSPRIGLIY